MNESTQDVVCYRVGDLEIDAGTREVRRGVDVLDLPGLSFDLLLALVRAAPKVLDHDELEERVWGGRAVSPETLTQRVKLVRDALGDTSESPRYIAVVRGRGVRLIANVDEAHDDRPVGRTGWPTILTAALVLLIVAAVLVVGLVNRSEVQDPRPTLPPGSPSIAVLSFDDLSSNKDQEHFSDAMSETLIRELAQVSGLKVIAKTSSFYFKDKEVRIVDIADELQVGHILEGSVQRDGNRIRVTTQLIDVSDNSPVWSESFDRELVDLFAVQDEVAREVVAALRVTLLEADEARLARRYRPSLEAYEQLILGRREYERNTAESMAAAERHYQRAIEIDPGYAMAYVDLATTYRYQVASSGLLMADSIARRQRLLERALELDPLSGEAYAARAFLHRDRGHLEQAESDFLKAIELNPNYATAYQWYSSLLSELGRFDEALAQMEVAASLDPIAPYVQMTLVSALWYTGRVEETQQLIRRNIERHPELPTSYLQMALIQTDLGFLGEAQRWEDHVRTLNPTGPAAWRWQCVGLVSLGDGLAAENCIRQLGQAHPDLLQTFYARFLLQLFQGDHDAAIATQKSVVERLPGRPAPIAFLADLLAGKGELGLARRMMTDGSPDLLDDEVEVAANDLHSALILAAILDANGETRQRDVLLAAMENCIEPMDGLRGYAYGPLETYIHALRGDRDRAIAALRKAIEVGWRANSRFLPVYWWQLRKDWKLEILHQDPEFIALMNELEAEVLKQRQWYEENRDEPLF